MRKAFSRLSSQDIIDLKDEEVNKAFFLPSMSPMAHKIYKFVYSNISGCKIYSGGMSSYVAGVNKDRLERLAERRGIDLVVFDYFVNNYTNAMLEQQNKEIEKNK